MPEYQREMQTGEAWKVSKPRMYGAMAQHTPNNKMDARFNRKGHERAKRIADSATPKAEIRLQKEKRLRYGM